jgi:hypothetical protein
MAALVVREPVMAVAVTPTILLFSGKQLPDVVILPKQIYILQPSPPVYLELKMIHFFPPRPSKKTGCGGVFSLAASRVCLLISASGTRNQKLPWISGRR